MVIGNDKAGGGSGSHLVLAKGCGKTRDRFFGPAKRIFPCNCPPMGSCMQARNIASRQSG
jgi:hypothetical protein